MASYRLSEQAKGDLERTYLYGLERFGELQADQYFQRLFEQLDVIAQAPYQYPAADDVHLGHRRCVCGVDSIYFRLHENSVEIVAIVGRQFFEREH